MRAARWVIGILTFSGAAFAQSYTVSTFAGSLASRPDSRPPNSPISSPVGIGADGAGNLYFASWNCIFKLDKSGTLTRLAGNYFPGQATGNPGGPSRFTWSQYVGMAVTRAGTTYVPVGNAIWEIFGDGSVAPIATQTPLYTPNHLAVDSSGNIYASETFQGRIDKINPLTGAVTQYVGGGTISPLNGGTATGVYISSPLGLALDAAGNLYFADSTYQRVFKVAQDGMLSVVAGSASKTNTNGDSGDGGPATSATLDGPMELAVDGTGNLYIATLGLHVREVSPDGIITTVAGNGSWGYSGDGGMASSASVAPHGLATDSAGNLYVADFGANRVRKVAANGTITTVAGDGTYGPYSGDGGQASAAQLSLPGAIAFDAAGNLYVADVGNNRVRKIAPDGTITTVAGNGSPGSTGNGGPATSAQIVPYGGLAVDSSGNLYIRDSSGIRKVTTDGIIHAVAGTDLAALGFGLTVGTVGAFNLAAGLPSGNGLTADAAGNLFEEGPPATGIDKIGPDGSFTFVVSDHFYAEAMSAYGSGDLYVYSGYTDQLYNFNAANPFGEAMPSLGAGCSFQAQTVEAKWTALAADSNGNLYAAMPTDSGVPAIRRFLTSGASYDVNLAGVGAPFRLDTLAVDAQGNLYGSDPLNGVVHVLRPVAAAVTIGSVTNAASNLAGPITPGEIVVLYGQGLGPSELMSCQYGSAGLTDLELNGTQVFINGAPAPVLYTSAGQVAVVAPTSLAGSSAEVTANYEGQESAAASVSVAAAAPGLFTLDGSGKGQAAAVNLNGTINGPSTPAKAGSYISLYATGTGQNLPVTVTIGGQAVTPQFAGQAPGYLAGLTQVNAQIPANVAGSAVPVSIQVSGVSSQAGVTISVAAQ